MYSDYGTSESGCDVEEEEHQHQCHEEHGHHHHHHHHHHHRHPDADDHEEDEDEEKHDPEHGHHHDHGHGSYHHHGHDNYHHGFVYQPPEYHESPFPGPWPYPPHEAAYQTEYGENAYPPPPPEHHEAPFPGPWPYPPHEAANQAYPPQFDTSVYQPPPSNVYPYPKFNSNLDEITDDVGGPPQAEISEESGIVSPQTNLPQGRLVRVFCKAYKECSLAVIDDKLAVVRADFEDESQQWIVDLRYAIQIRDIYGHPAFKLVHKATEKVMKHTDGELQEPQLVDYDANADDDILFWTESQDFGDGFKTIRMASDTLLNLTVQGSTVILDTWHKKDTQLWKIFPL